MSGGGGFSGLARRCGWHRLCPCGYDVDHVAGGKMRNIGEGCNRGKRVGNLDSYKIIKNK